MHAIHHHALAGSMGRLGAAGDSAAMESFFALLQKNVLDRKFWTTREDLRIAIVTWIERTYHRRRRQDRLGRLTPIEFEAIMTTAVDLAAYPLSPIRAAVPFFGKYPPWHSARTCWLKPASERPERCYVRAALSCGVC